MTQPITERIEIIDSFISRIKWKKETPEKQNKILKWIWPFDLIPSILLLIFVIYISAMAILEIEPEYSKWNKSELLVLLAMVMTIRAPFSYIEFLLKKHKQTIKNLDINFKDSLNQDLNQIISELNNTEKRRNYMKLPIILIAIGAWLQILGYNPYWDQFTYFILPYSICLLINICNYSVSFFRKYNFFSCC